MTIELALTKHEIKLILGALHPAEVEAIRQVTELTYEFDDVISERPALRLLNKRDEVARLVNDIQRLSYYLRAKGDC